MADKKRNHYEEKFKKAKRELREGAFILYFESLFREDDIDEIFEASSEVNDPDDNINISEESCELAKKIASKADEIDTIIAELSTKRSVDRIAKINLAILRLAIYEAKFEDSVPVNVAISEAVLLARKYARDPDVSFINGVLGAFSRSGREE
ncbi:MAG: transcription antitermination factor NusB [Ruminococcus sp.]|nr:transcription antitermination factor NusB [Ruminococcus sp.]